MDWELVLRAFSALFKVVGAARVFSGSLKKPQQPWRPLKMSPDPPGVGAMEMSRLLP